MSANEEQISEIFENPVTAVRVAAAGAFLEKCMYVTTCLLSMADALEELDDTVGARVLRTYASEFAEYEASTL